MKRKVEVYKMITKWICIGWVVYSSWAKGFLEVLGQRC